MFLGPEIFKCKGCTINWKEPGKNLTVKTVKKKQKHKSKGNVRTITKQVKNDSFFNFFDPPPISDDPEADVDPETQVILTKQAWTLDTIQDFHSKLGMKLWINWISRNNLSLTINLVRSTNIIKDLFHFFVWLLEFF